MAMPPPWLPPVTATRDASTPGCDACGLHGPHGVGEHPPVVVGLGRRMPLVIEARMRGRAGGLRVGGVPDRPRGALAAGVHEQVARSRRPATAVARAAGPGRRRSPRYSTTAGSGPERPRGRWSQPLMGEPPKPANVTSNVSTSARPVSTGSKVAPSGWRRASASVEAQKSRQVGGDRQVGRVRTASRRAADPTGPRTSLHQHEPTRSWRAWASHAHDSETDTRGFRPPEHRPGRARVGQARSPRLRRWTRRSRM